MISNHHFDNATGAVRDILHAGKCVQQLIVLQAGADRLIFFDVLNFQEQTSTVVE